MEDKLMSLQEELLQKVNDRKQYDDIAKEILKLRERKDKAETEMFQRTTNINRIKEVCDCIETHPQELTKYDDPLMPAFSLKTSYHYICTQYYSLLVPHQQKKDWSINGLVLFLFTNMV